jgi:hypothetical protein
LARHLIRHDWLKRDQKGPEPRGTVSQMAMRESVVQMSAITPTTVHPQLVLVARKGEGCKRMAEYAGGEERARASFLLWGQNRGSGGSTDQDGEAKNFAEEIHGKSLYVGT